jgi:PucR family transcriptional regulator, purine catabolism regulatory protein
MDADASDARAMIVDAGRKATDWSRSLRGLHGAMVEAVAGEAGLEGVAELAADAVAAPVAIVAPRLGGAWLAPAAHLSTTELDELVGEVMDRVADPRVRAPAALVKEAPIVIAGEAVGVVALLRTRPESIAPRLGDESDAGVVGALRFAGVAGVDDALVAPHATKVIHLAAMAALTGAVVADVRQEAERRLRGSAEEALVLARRLSARLRHSADVRMSAGGAAPLALSRASPEAERLLELAGRPLAGTSDVGGSGTYRLLLRVMASYPGELQLLYDETVAPLVRYDGQYRTDLLATLRAYLANNCNMNATAAAVLAHRHTIAYRLERIKGLSGLDPSDSEDRERLGLGLKAHELIVAQLAR